jgi:hypothetical protein
MGPSKAKRPEKACTGSFRAHFCIYFMFKKLLCGCLSPENPAAGHGKTEAKTAAEDGKVGIFTGADAPCLVFRSDFPGGVDGGGLNGLPKRHTEANQVLDFLQKVRSGTGNRSVCQTGMPVFDIDFLAAEF